MNLWSLGTTFMNKVSILNVPFSSATHEETIAFFKKCVEQNKKTFVVTANPEIVMYANKNKEYMDILQQADWITPDGIGIVKAAPILKQHIPERVSGYDLFLDLLELSDKEHLSVYFLGAKNDVLQKVLTIVTERYPNVRIVGSHHGYFGTNDENIVKDIQETKPDFIFTALGYPVQEKWISKHLPIFEKGIFIGIGGSFDVISGKTKRAPKLYRNLNLEWLYRIVSQPKRIKRALYLPVFAMQVIWKRFF